VTEKNCSIDFAGCQLIMVKCPYYQIWSLISRSHYRPFQSSLPHHNRELAPQKSFSSFSQLNVASMISMKLFHVMEICALVRDSSILIAKLNTCVRPSSHGETSSYVHFGGGISIDLWIWSGDRGF
jgi:hypothetical protein